MKVLGLLVALPILIGYTDAAINSWNLNNAGAQSNTNFDFSSSPVTKDESDDTTVVLFTLVAAGDNTVTSSVPDPPGKFTIDNTAGVTLGQVKLASGQVLDRETDGASIIIKIQALDDDGTSVTTGSATVTLSITDVNDNTPIFSAPASSPHSVEISDGSAAGAALYTVTATDADVTDNTVTYSINSGDTNGDFTIASSGAITVATGKTLAKSTTPSYALVIHAVDSASSPNTGSATLSVTVCDPCSNGIGRHAAGFLSFIIALIMCVKKAM